MPFKESPKICPVCQQGKQFTFVRDFRRGRETFSLYQCSECQVQFWLPMESAKHEWYEKSNPYKVRELAGSKICRGYHKNFLRRYKIFPENTKILDLGCGAGEFIFELKKRGCKVWGVDFDGDAIMTAKHKFGLENVYSLPFEEFFQKKDLPKFDIITFFEVLEHLDNPWEFVANAKKFLKPEGKMFFSVPYRNRIFADLNKWDFPPHHFTRWDQAAVLDFFEKSGFFVPNIEYVEQFKILSESLSGRFRTGLVDKLLTESGAEKKQMLFPKTLYFLSHLKDFVVGRVPASFLWIFSKLSRRRNGLMLVELKEKNFNAPVRKKVIFLLPTLGIGGGERVVSQLSLSLPDSVETTIVLFKNHISYPYKGKLICINVPISNPPLKRIYYFFVGISRLKKIIKEEKADYVISFGVPAGVMNVLTNKKTLLRVDGTVSIAHGFLYRLLIKVFYNKANKIMCVSKVSAKDLVDNFGIGAEKIKIIYNPLNIKEIQSLSLETLKPENTKIFRKPTIITIGRLTKQKSQWHLIRAFRAVKDIVKDAQLVILGAGELEKELKQIAEGLGLGNDIYFLGWQKNPFKFLAKANVFVLSSFWEGLPYVLLEAMACGLPVISADCKSGPREILAPKTDINYESKHVEYGEFGILTPSFDGRKLGAADPLTKSEKFLAQAMVKILTDKKIAAELARKSRQRANDFDIKNIIKQWKFLYE